MDVKIGISTPPAQAITAPSQPHAGVFYSPDACQAKIMITNGGPHSPQKWAALVMDRLLYIGDQSHPRVIAKANEFKQKVELALILAFEKAQQWRKNNIHHASPEMAAMWMADEVVSAIDKAAKGTHFAIAAQSNAYRDKIFSVVRKSLGTILMIEDKWADDLGRPYGAS